MHIFNKFRGTRGFISTSNYALRLRRMITEQAKKRCQILKFWNKYGDEATKEAFGTSRRTLFRWRTMLGKARGRLEGLNPVSTAPHTKRQRIILPSLESRIVTLRTTYPRLGKDKLYGILNKEGFTISSSTIGQIIDDLKSRGKLLNPVILSINGRTGNLREKQRKRRVNKLRRPKGYRVLELDTIVRFVNGVKRYILTAIDTEKRTAFAAAYTNHGLVSSADFLTKAYLVLPDCPKAIQTDNGSEFALHFRKAAEELNLVHFHTYPRTPKMNAHVERFNRTLDEEFLQFNRNLLRDNVRDFNNKLIDWLLWYNGERPHYALGQIPPLHFLLKSLQIPTVECQMRWTHT